MATLSIRMSDIIKEKANKIAHNQGVLMNNFIICSVSTAISQFDSINYFRNELKGLDKNKIAREFETIMKNTQKGKFPEMKVIDSIIYNK